MQSLGKTTTPIVDRTFKRKQCVRGARQSLVWGGVNLLLAGLMYLELGYGPLFEILNIIQPILWYTECGLALLFTANFLWDILAYFAWTLSATIVDINPLQRKLMGVKDYEVGFRNPRSRIQEMSVGTPQMTPTPAYSPSSFTGTRSAYSGISSPVTPPHLTSSTYNSFNPYSSFSAISPLGNALSPLAPTPPSLSHRTPSPSPGSSPGHGSSHSGSYMGSPGFLGTSGVMDGSGYGSAINTSMSKSYSMAAAPSPLSMTNTLSPLFRESDVSGLRSRFTGSSLKSSPLRSDECITDQKALGQFLSEQQDKEFRRQAASPDMSPGANASFWNYNRSLSDHTPILRKYQYQIACRSPQQTKVKDDDTDEPVSYRADEVWSSQNVQLADVDRWIEHLRKWLSNTILTHLVKEINKINRSLARVGCEDMQIGEVSISILKQLVTTKAQHVPTLNSVIPFLEVCANQEYLVFRIRELGSGGAMSGFKWNGGGVYKGKAWGEHLPSDSAILMHVLCTYMDARLPPHPKYPDGKTFTTQYFMKTPDKPDLTKKDNLLLYQSKVNPPHFKVILEDDILNPPKGRNNIFHAILLFLRYIHVKQHGMLGRINLGMSGINILWVMDANPQLVTSEKPAITGGFISSITQTVKHALSPRKDGP